MSLPVGARFGPYEVLAPLGAGGMGEVYLALDTRLGRKVALKTLSDLSLATADARRRVLHEARAAGALNHPNIAAIYDVLETEAGTAIVMEYVDGEPLTTAVRRGPVAVDVAVDIGLQLANALVAAHAAQVIHRDLKPANITVRRDGVVKVLDFGVARVLRPDTTLRTTATTVARVAGTPAYMAPEQLVHGVTDVRADVYSAGAVLFELLTGRCPYSGGDPIALAIEKTRESAPDVRMLNPQVPGALAAIIARALDRDPSARYQTAAELEAALQSVAHDLTAAPTAEWTTGAPRPALPWWRRATPRSWRSRIAVAAALLVVAVGLYELRRARATPPRTGPAVVAILPLDNLSGDSARDYLGAGIAETMSATLANLADVAVISRSEIVEARRRSSQPRELARSLAASYVVTGGVQENGGQLQVTVNLTEPDGRVVWGGVYTAAMGDVFGLERRMAEDVSVRLAARVSRAAPASQPTTSVEALAAYWEGRAFLEKPGTQAATQAIARFERAVALDNRFALAHAALGLGYWTMYQDTKENVWSDRAALAAESAHRLNSGDAEVHTVVGRIYQGTGHSREAIDEASRALALQPNTDAAHRLLGDIYSDQGRIDEAIAEYHRALALRPNYWGSYRSLGLAQLKAGRFTSALASFRRITELQPEDPRGYQLLGNVYLSTMDLPRAAASYERAIELGPSAATYSNLGTVYYSQGRFDLAAATYQKAIAQVPGWSTMHRNLADAYRRMGRAADARTEYARAIELFGQDLEVNPDDASALAVRGICEARLGRIDAARRDAVRATALAGRNAGVLYKSACVSALTGDLRRAIDELRRALELGYSAALAREDDDLAPLRGRADFQQLVIGR